MVKLLDVKKSDQFFSIFVGCWIGHNSFPLQLFLKIPLQTVNWSSHYLYCSIFRDQSTSQFSVRFSACVFSDSCQSCSSSLGDSLGWLLPYSVRWLIAPLHQMDCWCRVSEWIRGFLGRGWSHLHPSTWRTPRIAHLLCYDLVSGIKSC